MLASIGSRFTSTRLSQLLLGLVIAVGAWSLQPRAAHAAMTIAGDLDLQVPISVNGVGTGGGFGIRLGTELHLPLVVVNPEVGFTYASFSKDAPPQVYRGILGVRVGVGELLRVGALAHIGFGYVNWNRSGVWTVGETSRNYSDLDHTGVTYDIGAFLEFTALPLLNIGVHAIYNRIADDEYQKDSLHWMSFGAHATLVL